MKTYYVELVTDDADRAPLCGGIVEARNTSEAQMLYVQNSNKKNARVSLVKDLTRTRALRAAR